MSAILLAIDPGSVSGAYAVFCDSWVSPVVGDLPVVDGQVNAPAFAGLLESIRGRYVLGKDGPEHSHNLPMTAVVERVGSMPKQGVSSTFKFGVAVGIIHGVLLGRGIPMRLITPSEWKRGMGVGADKEGVRALAIRMYPMVEGLHLKKHHGRAEALLLGHYALVGRL